MIAVDKKRVSLHIYRFFDVAYWFKDVSKKTTSSAHYAILSIFRKVKIRLERKKQQICLVYGEGIVNNRTCQKWFVKFLTGYWTVLNGQID